MSYDYFKLKAELDKYCETQREFEVRVWSDSNNLSGKHLTHKTGLWHVVDKIKKRHTLCTDAHSAYDVHDRCLSGLADADPNIIEWQPGIYPRFLAQLPGYEICFKSE